MQGQQQALSEEIQAAILNYKKAIEAAPKQIKNYIKLSQTFLEIDQFEVSLFYIEEAIKLQPNNSNAYVTLGNIQKKQGNIENAIQAFQKALDLNSTYFAAHRNLWEIYTNQNQLDLAVYHLQKAQAIKPDYNQVYISLGYCYRKKQQLTEAIAACQKAIDLGATQNFRVWKLLGELFQEQGEIKAAIEAYQKAIKLQPDHPKVTLNLQQLQAKSQPPRENQEEQTALDSYRKALPNFTNQSLQIYQSLGKQLLEQNSLQEAEIVYQKMVEQYPNKPQGYQGLGGVAMRRKNWRVALELWEKVLQIVPDSIPALVGRGNALLGLERFAEAETSFSNFVQQYPDKVQGYEMLAKLAMSCGQWQLALERWEKVLQISPDNLWALGKKGDCLRELADFNQAREVYQILLQKYPDQIQGYQGLAKLSQLIYDYQSALEYWEKVIEIQPEHNWARLGKVEALINLKNLEDTDQELEFYLDLIKTRPDPNAENTLIRTGQILLKLQRVQEVEPIFESLLQLMSEAPTSGILNFIYFYLKIVRKISILPSLISRINWNQCNLATKLSLCEGYILSNQYEQAVNLFQSIPPSPYCESLDKYRLIKSWYLALTDQIEEAKSWYKTTIYPYTPKSYPHLGSDTVHLLQYVSEHRQISVQDRDEILMFTVVKNELVRIGEFIDYYRNLGITKFFIVDNDSIDGTKEYLLAQEDVYLFTISGYYRESGAGIRWINYLADTYGKQNWCLYADPDEHLVFPHVEEVGLKPLLNYMDKKGQKIFFAFMLDLYAENIETQLNYTPEQGKLRDTFCYFDNTYDIVGQIEPPYKTAFGGFRARAFQLHRHPLLTKTPIFKGGCGIKLINSSHHVTPETVADVTGIFLHYKFVSYIFKLDHVLLGFTINEREYVQWCSNSETLKQSLKCENTVKYESSLQLQTLGLIQSNLEFDSYCFLVSRLNRLTQTQESDRQPFSETTIPYYQEAIQNFSFPSWQVYLDLGKKLFDINDLDESFIIYQKFVADNPNKHQGYEGLARIEMRRKNWTDALEQWEKVIEKSQKHLAAQNGKANALMQLQRLDEAEIIFSNLIGIHPNQHHGYEGLARLATQKKDWQTALLMWEKILQFKPDHFPAYNSKANILLELNQWTEAESVLNSFCEQYPDSLLGYEALAKLAMRSFDWQSAIERWEKVIQLSPQSLHALINKGKALMEWGKLDESEIIFTSICQNYPDLADGFWGLAKIAESRLCWENAIVHWEKAISLNPKNTDYRRGKVIILGKMGLIEETNQEIEQSLQLLRESDESTSDNLLIKTAQSLLTLFKHCDQIEELKPVFEKLFSSCLEQPNQWKIHLIYEYMKRKNQMNLLWEYIQQINWEDCDIMTQLRLCEGYILCNQYDLARDSICRLPNSLRSPQYLLLKSWQLAYDGQIEQAKAVYQQTVWPNCQRHLPSFGDFLIHHLKYISLDKVIQIDETGEILLFTKVKNEFHRIQQFLHYYRKLGVNHFFIIDNDSDDGTREYLSEQADVYLFFAKERFKESAGGTQWINYLIQTYAQKNWCLVVDTDEHLIFPGIEEYGLKSLLAYMDANDQKMLFTFMLDMYAENLETQLKYNPDTDKLSETFLYFDNTYSIVGQIEPPYFTAVGGLRSRFFDLNHGIMLTKTALIKAGSGVKIAVTAHVVTPEKVSDVTGLLLHYKFSGDMSKRENFGYHHNGAQQTYINLCRQTNPQEISFKSDVSVKYIDSRQLQSLGLIRSSVAFERFCTAKKFQRKLNKAFLHIGIEKTGTTTIQHFLANNRKQLLESGYLFPISPGKINQLKLALLSYQREQPENIQLQLGITDFSLLPKLRHEFQTDLSEELSQTSAENVIFSNENCSSLLMTEEEITNLKLLLEPFFEKICIIIYLRKQDELIFSHYSMNVRSGQVEKFSFPNSIMMENLYNYSAVLQKWEKVFGKDNIIVKVFQSEQMVNGNLLDDFMAIFGIDNLDQYEIPPKLNESLDIYCLEFLRNMNPYIPHFVDGQRNHLRGNLARLLETLSGQNKLRADSEQLKEFMANFEESNRHVAEYYLGRTNGQLFIEDVSKEKSSGVSNWDFNIQLEEAFRIFAELWCMKEQQILSEREERQQLHEKIENLEQKIKKLQSRKP